MVCKNKIGPNETSQQAFLLVEQAGIFHSPKDFRGVNASCHRLLYSPHTRTQLLLAPLQQRTKGLRGAARPVKTPQDDALNLDED